jgi:hypothetical protein
MEQHTVSLLDGKPFSQAGGSIGPLIGGAVSRNTHRHHIFQLIPGTGGVPAVHLDFSIDGTHWQEFAILSAATVMFAIYSNTPFPWVRARRTDTDSATANGVIVLLRSAGDATNLV